MELPKVYKPVTLRPKTSIGIKQRRFGVMVETDGENKGGVFGPYEKLETALEVIPSYSDLGMNTNFDSPPLDLSKTKFVICYLNGLDYVNLYEWNFGKDQWEMREGVEIKDI
jgi:hypothetical protein